MIEFKTEQFKKLFELMPGRFFKFAECDLAANELYMVISSTSLDGKTVQVVRVVDDSTRPVKFEQHDINTLVVPVKRMDITVYV